MSCEWYTAAILGHIQKVLMISYGKYITVHANRVEPSIWLKFNDKSLSYMLANTNIQWHATVWWQANNVYIGGRQQTLINL